MESGYRGGGATTGPRFRRLLRSGALSSAEAVFEGVVLSAPGHHGTRGGGEEGSLVPSGWVPGILQLFTGLCQSLPPSARALRGHCSSPSASPRCCRNNKGRLPEPALTEAIVELLSSCVFLMARLRHTDISTNRPGFKTNVSLNSL